MSVQMSANINTIPVGIEIHKNTKFILFIMTAFLTNAATSGELSPRSGQGSCLEIDHPAGSGKNYYCESWNFTGNAVGGPVFCSDRYTEPRYDEPILSAKTGGLIGFKCNPLSDAHKEYAGEGYCVETDHPAGSKANYYCDSWTFRGTAQGGPVLCSDGPEKYTEPTLSPKTGQIVGFKCSRPKVLVLIDSQTYLNLQTPIDLWIQDIFSEGKFNPKLIVGNWTTLAEVRTTLSNNKQNLDGSIFVGNIPIPRVLHSAVGTTEWDSDSDWPYQVFDSAWASMTDTSVLIPQTDKLADIWTSRILLPGKPEGEKLAFLQSYFEKNHRVRTTGIRFSGMSFILGSSDQMGTIEPSVFSSPLTLRNTFNYLQYLESISDLRTIWEPNDTLRKQTILNEISQHREVTSLHIHGHPDAEFVTGNILIRPEDIQGTNSNGLLLKLFSCYGGKMDGGSFMAGHYLVHGDTMVVEASPTMATSSLGSDGSHFGKFIKPLLMGKSIGYASINALDRGNAFLFGDPTFVYRLRPQGPFPWVGQKTITIDLGIQSFSSLNPPKAVIGHFNFENQGDVPLFVRGGVWSQTLNSKPWNEILPDLNTSAAFAYERVGIQSPKLNSDFFVEVPPHSSSQQDIVAHLVCNPASKCPEIKGLHQIKARYATNDPYHPYIDVVITYEIQ